MTDQEWKPYGTVKCEHCGRTHRQFVRAVSAGDLAGEPTSASCVCGWRLKEWSATGHRDYKFEIVDASDDLGTAPRKKRPRDTNQLAKSIVDIATGQVEDRDLTPEEQGKDPAAVSLGRKGGKKGGKARAEALSADRRSEIARKAAINRWESRKQKPD